MRTLIAGILGGIAMFIWASVAHVATPLATIGLKAMPDEAAVVARLHESLGDKPGLYFFPFLMGSVSDPKAAADQEAKMKVEPQGLLAYVPPGTPPLSPKQLATEFGLELLEAILAAFVIASAAQAGFVRRVAMATGIGLIAGMATNFSYWNWYGFSYDYTLANAFTEVMKFVFAGLAIAIVLGWGKRAVKA
jgi:hypothetical protein